ncbi:DUF305 domain-containing protein [Aminobacter ciceronei]|uniref:Uncharacterized protein (DUF305 family) n=1 Tax=Aminobacter ciceronei TaxID=150723 RepID=A0ABR6CHF4_9HYPH|nr:DUF305 domain-containing protein [Aminobacter ciceronei]MBA8910262.1 uncharacterized protein (DUF305 family) [Aminobacter ciceronei]MBA9024000.1 uncharacterized protein (DUF305 family) [Aminobacter ciceronei]
MYGLKIALAATLLALGNSGSAISQGLPAACKAAEGMDMKGMVTMPDMSGMDAQHQELMAAMMGMMRPQAMQAMMAKDPDVAFVCGMIVHHQGAIEMANAELKNGDNNGRKRLPRRSSTPKPGK